ncbi:MAG: hypothetical protein UHO11_08680 [Treponema sp.]|nr:hypothetical protein [Treponema sp.]
MKPFVKNAVGMVVAVAVCSGITVASSLGMFSKIEKSFYEPARLKTISDKLDQVAERSNEYMSNILNKIGPESGFISEEPVSSYFEREPSKEAGRLLGRLFDELPGLDGVRVVDQAGKRLQFSSYRNDYRTIKGTKTYFNYDELRTYSGNHELDFRVVSAFSSFSDDFEDDEEESEEEVLHSSPEKKDYKLVFDGKEQRLIVSYPYYYNDNTYSFIFYINPIDFATKLAEERIISLNDYLTLISSADGSTGGFVFNMPHVGRGLLANEILKRWDIHSYKPEEIASSAKVKMFGVTAGEPLNNPSSDEEYVSWHLITSPVSKYIFIGGLYSAEMLMIPLYVRILLLICSFMTVCLIIVILFNLKKDDDVVILSKIKAVQVGLINEYFEKSMDKNKVAALIDSQKENLTQKIKKSLGRRGRKYGEDLDIVLNQSWQDIINVLSRDNSSRVQGLSANDMTEIRRMFQDVVSNSTLRVHAVTQFPSRQPPKGKKLAEEHEEEHPVAVEIADEDYAAQINALPVEELEDVEPAGADDVEELEDAEPAGAADVEELEDVEPADADDMEELEDVEPTGADDVEELEDVEPADADEVEELEDVEPADAADVEELEDAESAGADDVEELEDVEPADAADVEELEDAEPVDAADVKELEDVEPAGADDVEELEDAEPAGADDSAEISSDSESAGENAMDETDYSDHEIEAAEVFAADELIEELEKADYVHSPELLIPKEDENLAAPTFSDDDEIEEAELVEDVPVESYQNTSESIIFSSPRNEVAQFEGSEPLMIGDSVPAGEAHNSESSVADDFVVYNSLNMIFEENANAFDSNSEIHKDSTDEKKKLSDGNLMKNSENNQNDDIKELESISEQKDDFMFTTFAANDNNVTELSPEAIIQGDDGVFSISENLVLPSIRIDEDFKRLVDSVLK